MSSELELNQTQTQKSVDEHQTDDVDSLITTILDDANKLQSLYRNWVNTVKKLTKEIQKQKKKLSKQKTKRKVKQRPQKVNSAMRSFMKEHIPEELKDEKDSSGMYTRQVMMKTVSSYIKSQNIQNEENRKQWSGKDKVLKKLFKLDSEWYTFMQINGLISRVVKKQDSKSSKK